MKKCSILFLILLLISILEYSQAEQKIPAEAQQKAEESLKKLGPERGALSLSYKVLKIIGVVSGIKIDEKKVNQNLKDLNARVSKTRIEIALSGDVLFDFDRWNIRKDAETILLKVIEVIQAYKSPLIIVNGFTDSKGSEEYNTKLSLKRASSVKGWMLKHSSITSDSIKINGYGELEPVALNKKPDGSDNPEGRQKNRRVEFVIEKLKK